MVNPVRPHKNLRLCRLSRYLCSSFCLFNCMSDSLFLYLSLSSLLKTVCPFSDSTALSLVFLLNIKSNFLIIFKAIIKNCNNCFNSHCRSTFKVQWVVVITAICTKIQYVQEVVIHFIQYASYIKWVTTSWTHSIILTSQFFSQPLPSPLCPIFFTLVTYACP